MTWPGPTQRKDLRKLALPSFAPSSEKHSVISSKRPREDDPEMQRTLPHPHGR